MRTSVQSNAHHTAHEGAHDHALRARVQRWLLQLRVPQRRKVRSWLILEGCLLVLLLGLALLSPLRHEPLKVLLLANTAWLLPLRMIRVGLRLPTPLWLQWARALAVVWLLWVQLGTTDLGESAWPLLFIANMLALDALVSALYFRRWNFLLLALGVPLFSFGLLAGAGEQSWPWLMLLGAGLVFGVSWWTTLLSALWWGQNLVVSFSQPDLTDGAVGQYLSNTATLHGSTIFFIALATYIGSLLLRRLLPPRAAEAK